MGGGPDFPCPREEEPAGKDDNEHLWGVVDMGSNGIRLSVTNLAPPTSRILPTLVSYRLDVSLYSAQYDDETGERIPIPQDVIDTIIGGLLRFRVICNDLNVPKKQIRIIATEATRTAVNSEEYRKAIKNATGLTVEMLGKEEEGYVGALGVASGFSNVSGIVMDLGGGSTQITWMVAREGKVRVSPKGSVSFPYGAAALTKRLGDLKKGKSSEEGDKAVAKLRDEMEDNFASAYEQLKIPEDLMEQAKAEGGFRLYLSGGGFRGWGYLLLYMNQIKGNQGNHHPYPISLINGYTASKKKFEDVETLKKVAREAEDIFRVSDRRRGQVPAVAFLVNALSKSTPHGIKEAHFCQGGVREGVMFRELSQEIKDYDPLEVGTLRYAHESANAMSDLIFNAIPKDSTKGGRKFPDSFNRHVIHAFTNVMYVHVPMNKEAASTAALYTTSTGFMSGIHGVSHADRALLALMLEARYEGELPPREVDFKRALENILTPEEVWWSRYLGEVGQLIGAIYPAGIIDEKNPRLKIDAEWASDFGKKHHKEGLRLILSIKEVKKDKMMMKDTLEELAREIRKVGKKKNWVGGRNGWGMAIDYKIKEVNNLCA
ncbi:hypothetical protein HYALB_00012900 [Hymenoscyphus albidus]|uniref:Ppx/GppA phosphatase domain-containing protein n=1 Tax=Hymenoscyphus albidus TaxID=595503 RepID=A0A9N9Q8R9_9HELO|nr:hypothetical protein HYALB_00012900 [Hymenoscyphus albidus]